MAGQKKNIFGNPVGGNYASVPAPRPSMGSSKVGARATQKTTGSPEKPPARGVGSVSTTHGPHHYGERAHTTIKPLPGPNGGSARPPREPRH